MSFETKVYVVTEVLPTGGEKVLDVKLTHESARDIAKEGPNRKVERFIATK